jgi:hypothetical protein
MDNLTPDIKQGTVDPSSVIGWAVDADPENDPTYPIKDRNNGEHKGYSWDRPEQQPIDMEVLHSTERPNIAATFGHTIPPAGLSGMLRRSAFKYSEDAYMHWLPLIVADRVNMVEGIFQDLGRGHIPNVFSEMGWKAEWKYNRKSLVTRVVVGAAVASVIYALLKRNGSNDSADEWVGNQEEYELEIDPNGPAAGMLDRDPGLY